MCQHVKISQSEGVLRLVLARPEKKNALTDAMYGALADAMEAAETDPGVRVILFRSEGDAFTAGNDLGDFAAANAGGGSATNVWRFIRALASASKPLVAAVQGRAVGIGTTLLLHCDLVILADNAQLTTPFVGLALTPEAASSLLLPGRIGHARAFGMFALGESLDAGEALRCGVASKVTLLTELEAAAEAIARRLAQLPLPATIATKRLMRDAEALRRQIVREQEEFAVRLASPEAAEAFAAFAERRPPDFSRFI